MSHGLRSRLASLVALTLLVVAPVAPAAAGPVLLYDTDGDRVLYAEDADQPWYAASLTKMMTAYLVFEAWKTGRVKSDAKLTISAYANSQPKMRLGLGAGKEISYDDAVKALIIKSANDIAVALAEGLSGTEEAFVAEMNAKTAKLGMSATKFINPHGLPGEGQYTTAKDMALLASALMRDFPEHMHYFSITMTEVGDKKKKVIATHNPVLMNFEGGDGFKTGFTCSAGYNIVASASRNGKRLVAVVLGEDSSAKRAIKTKEALEYGFQILGWKALFKLPTIHSMPEGTYDREKVRAANLIQRFKDCQDPASADEEARPEAGTAEAKAGPAPATTTAPVAANASTPPVAAGKTVVHIAPSIPAGVISAPALKSATEPAKPANAPAAAAVPAPAPDKPAKTPPEKVSSGTAEPAHSAPKLTTGSINAAASPSAATAPTAAAPPGPTAPQTSATQPTATKTVSVTPAAASTATAAPVTTAAGASTSAESATLPAQDLPAKPAKPTAGKTAVKRKPAKKPEPEGVPFPFAGN